jgi:ankyrin repeat protein
MVLAAHAAVDQADSKGSTPLLAACDKGDGGCVQLLLAAHAAVDQANSVSVTPLLAASWSTAAWAENNKGRADLGA